MYFLTLSRLCVVVFTCFSFNAIAQKTEKPLSVIVQKVAFQELQNDIEALGTLHASNAIVLTAKTTKTVAKIYFEDGQRVKKGDILVAMADDEEIALKQEASINAEEAKKQYDRVKLLSKTGAVSATLFDQSYREYEASKAHLAALDAKLKELHVLAPFDGVIGIHNISVGSLIAPGQTIATLNDDSKMKLDFSVPAVHLQSLSVGLAVDAKSNDLNKVNFKSAIVSIDNQIDESTRSIKVRVLLDNASKELKQGMLMNVIVHADKRKALVVSEAALVPLGSNNFVFVLQNNNKELIAVKRQIQIGKRYAGFVEVIAGVGEGDRVVTHGLQKIKDGQMVLVLAEQSGDMNKSNEPLSELLKQKSQ